MSDDQSDHSQPQKASNLDQLNRRTPSQQPPSRPSSPLLNRIITIIKLLWSPFSELMEVRNALKYCLYRLYLKGKSIAILNYKCIKIRREMDKVSTYKEYEQLGLILDKLQGKELWKQEKESHLYDFYRIESRLYNMRVLRESKDIQGLVHCLRQDLQKNIGGICNPALYNVCKVGTKKLIEDYHNEVIKCI